MRNDFTNICKLHSKRWSLENGGNTGFVATTLKRNPIWPNYAKIKSWNVISRDTTWDHVTGRNSTRFIKSHCARKPQNIAWHTLANQNKVYCHVTFRRVSATSPSTATLFPLVFCLISLNFYVENGPLPLHHAYYTFIIHL